MILTHKESDEVLYPDEDIITLSILDLEELKQMAKFNPRKRIRLCAHRQPKENLHEMFIVHAKDCYVRPHKHLGKAESMSVLKGEVDVVLFDEDGRVIQLIEMGEYESGKMFYNRLCLSVYHMLLIQSEYLIFHEVTEGPFILENTVFPSWAPIEGTPNVDEYMTKIISTVGERREHA